MSMSRKMRRAEAKSGNGGDNPPPRHPQVRAALDMAARLRNEGKLGEALDLCQRILPIEPNLPEVHFAIASIKELAGDSDAAAESYARVIALAPRLLPGLLNYGACLSRLGRFEESLELYERARKLAPSEPHVHQHLCLFYQQLRQHGRALVHNEWLARHRGQYYDWTDLAAARDRVGDQDGALEAYERARRLVSMDAALRTSMSRTYQVKGEREAARAQLDLALRADPHAGYARLSKAKYFTQDDALAEEIAALRSALAATSGRPVEESAAPLNFALGRLLERRGDVDASYAAYRAANQAIAPLRKDQDEARAAEISADLATLTPERLSSLARYGSASRKPTFILGMPRSGTTLIEQIIASHSEVYGLGEVELLPSLVPALKGLQPERISRSAQIYLDAYPAVAADARRVTDKSISSFYYLGQILLMFPNARIINCERQPMDIIWSIFTEYFQDQAIAYSYDLKRIVRHLRFYRQILDNWEAVAPGRVLKVHYEHVVADVERESRRLADYLDLRWEPGMVDFHKNDRIVRTASLEQVRQPIYKSSVARWQKFSAPLASTGNDIEDLCLAYDKALGG